MTPGEWRRSGLVWVFLPFLFTGLLCAAGCSDEGGRENEGSDLKVAPAAIGEKAPAGEPGEVPVDGDWLITRIGAEPATLNPITASDAYESTVNSDVYESLLERNNETLELEGELAEGWEISDDHLAYTFRIRKGVTFHDGLPMTALDVKFAFDTIKDPAVDAPHLRNYYKDVETCEVIDDHNIRFTMSKPYFKALEMIGGIPVIPKHVFEKGDFNDHPNGRHPVGTGPYRFVKWDTGSRITLERNPDYWGEKPRIDRVAFLIITDNTAALQVFKKGELDLMGVRPNQWVRDLEPSTFQREYKKAEYYTPNYSYIGWNSRRPYFEDKRARQAMTMLVNREMILEKILFGLGKIVTGNFYINGPEYDHDLPVRAYDPEAAGKLLDEAGWSDHDGDGLRDKDGRPFSFEFLISSGSQFAEQLATILKESLLEAGIEMNIRKLEWAVFTQFLDERNYDAVTLAWRLAVESDPYQLWHSSQAVKGGSNHVGFINAEADDIIERARIEFDKEKRVAMYRRFHSILYEEQPYTFLFCSPSLVIRDHRFRNVKVYPLGMDSSEWFVPKELQRYPM